MVLVYSIQKGIGSSLLQELIILKLK